MKKVILMVALVAVSASAQAKMFAYGVKAGLELPHVQSKDLSASAKASTGFHVGVFAQLNIPVVGIGIQPEVLYAHRGVSVVEAADRESKAKGVSYIDVPVSLTWGIDLKVVRPFVALTPYISYAFNDVKTSVYNGADHLHSHLTNVDNFDYGLGAGLGLELLQRVQLMGRYSWGLKDLIGDGSYKVRGFSLSLGWIF